MGQLGRDRQGGARQALVGAAQEERPCASSLHTPGTGGNRMAANSIDLSVESGGGERVVISY